VIELTILENFHRLFLYGDYNIGQSNTYELVNLTAWVIVCKTI
jgi:hypothetical protein